MRATRYKNHYIFSLELRIFGACWISSLSWLGDLSAWGSTDLSTQTHTHTHTQTDTHTRTHACMQWSSTCVWWCDVTSASTRIMLEQSCCPNEDHFHCGANKVSCVPEYLQNQRYWHSLKIWTSTDCLVLQRCYEDMARRMLCTPPSHHKSLSCSYYPCFFSFRIQSSVKWMARATVLRPSGPNPYFGYVISELVATKCYVHFVPRKHNRKFINFGGARHILILEPQQWREIRLGAKMCSNRLFLY